MERVNTRWIAYRSALLGSGKIPMFVSRKNFLANVFHAKASITL